MPRQKAPADHQHHLCALICLPEYPLVQRCALKGLGIALVSAYIADFHALGH